jgi:hypothetical protein
MSPASGKPPAQRTAKPPAPRKGKAAKPRPKGSPEPSQAVEQGIARGKALDALYRPLREAGEAELQKTKPGRKLLEETRAFGAELGELYKTTMSGKTPSEEGLRLARERQREFRERYGNQLLEAHARHAHLQPSVEAVALTLRPEMAAQTTWVSETSFLRSMLLQPKAAPEDAGVVRQGLGEPPPPAVQSCTTPPYGRSYDHQDGYDVLASDTANEATPDPQRGQAEIAGNCWCYPPFNVQFAIKSAFVGQDFPVPAGPTSYTATVSYDWVCTGWGWAAFGVAVVNADLAIVIDKRDGSSPLTYAREVSLLTVPFAGGDGFTHEAIDVKVTIPFHRDGSNGTVRIMVGADGNCTTVAATAGAFFRAIAKVREICINSAV